MPGTLWNELRETSAGRTACPTENCLVTPRSEIPYQARAINRRRLVLSCRKGQTDGLVAIKLRQSRVIATAFTAATNWQFARRRHRQGLLPSLR